MKTQTERTRGLKIKTGVKAGDYDGCCGRTGGNWIVNHNETQVAERTRGFTVKTSIKAGPRGLKTAPCDWCCPPEICGINHNETQVRDAA